MRFAIVGLLSLIAAGNGWAQEAQLSWTNINTPAGSAAAWAMQPAADATANPRVIVVMRSAIPGTAPGTDTRVSQMLTMEADCPGGKMQPIAQATFGDDFHQTAAPSVDRQWGTFAEYGEYGAIVNYACNMKNPPVLWQADIKGAQQKLDATIPKPKIPITPPVTATFEYVGKSATSYQPIHYWLDTASITREGALAKAWTLEVWETGWSRIHDFPPITWRLREFRCEDKIWERNVWFQQIGSDLTASSMSERELPDAKFSVVGDTNIVSLAKRVCNNRPLLFSRTIKGDLKTLVSRNYLGASEKLASGIPLDRPPAVQLVDLGPKIVIKEKDANWSYTGTFTRSGGDGSGYYIGVVQTDGIENPNNATVAVRGIVDGKLVIERAGTPEGEYAIPMTNGKPSGKGLASWERDDDAYSWTLVEPTTITLK